MVATKSGANLKKPKAKIPEYLIYEIIDGKPIHYKGYQEILAETKTWAEIIGTSALQSLIITHLVILIGKLLDENLYTILTNEAGLHLDRRNNLAGDIMIFDNDTLPIEAIDEHYAQVPPKIVIEVDTTADPTDIHPEAYTFKKTQKPLDFGVKKVIWIATQAEKVSRYPKRRLASERLAQRCRSDAVDYVQHR